MYTKTISVNTNWLDTIDGKTVADAIAYLQTLNPEHMLTYTLEGDTHGCRVEAELQYTVPMTNKEILAQLEKDYARQLAEKERFKTYVIKHGQHDRLPVAEKSIADIEAKREEARRKYGEGV